LPSITRLRSALGQQHQVLVPINAHGHVVGVLYIDRAATRPPMRPGTPEALAIFAQLAGIALEAASRKS
jgi:GAF domain-containing protein